MRTTLIIFCLSIVFSSCAKIKEKKFIDARSSFVRVVIEEQVKICDDGSCLQKTFNGSSSGAVIEFEGEKVVLTAAHSCTPNDSSELKKLVNGKIEVEVKLYGYDIHNMKHILKIKKLDKGEDICILETDTLWQDAVPIADSVPKYDEQVYNFAAPQSIFANHMVPLLTGYYVGEKNGMAAYTIPAAAGSSGSIIVNKRGELVGMIHSVHVEFNHFTLSPTLEAFKYFLDLEDKSDHNAGLSDMFL
tara:strand:+ start:3786 stop:4523 length:738 start_codon:yes stop_codon:yes gene_type:complete